MDQRTGLIRVLIIDDDSKLLQLLSDYISQFEMEAITASDPMRGLQLLAQRNPEFVVLDVMMPGMDGFETCRRIRSLSSVPVLMLSARGETMDRIVGLELGADDYMAKPFEPRELVTRIQAILRRSGTEPTNRDVRFHALEVRPLEREAYLENVPLKLTSMEFELLYILVRYPGRKFSRDELTAHLQGVTAASYGRSIDILISRLRSKLGENARNPRYIKSVHGFGYVFIGNQNEAQA